MTAPRRLAYWARTIDRLVDEQVADAVEADGIDRRQWPVLMGLHHGSVRAEEVETLLAPLTGPGPTASEVLRSLVADGLAEVQADDFRLTAEGVARVEALQAGPVQAVVERATADLGEAELEQLLASLERVARNLGWLDPA